MEVLNTWYNYELFKKQHAEVNYVQDSDFGYSKLEHASGELVIMCIGHKNGIATNHHDFKTTEFYKTQASFLELQIIINYKNAFPELKCCRQLYGYNNTIFSIQDKLYANKVLTTIFEKYTPQKDMKQFILMMFDDWDNINTFKTQYAREFHKTYVIGKAISNKKRNLFNILKCTRSTQ